MNFLDGAVSDGKVVIGDRPVGVARNAVCRDGQSVMLGIRSKHIRPADKGSGDGHPFKVDLVEPTGDEMDLKGTIYGQPATMVMPYQAVRAQQTIDVLLPEDALYFFDAGTGARLEYHGV